MNIPIDFTWLEATSLAAVRITAFLVLAPPFSHGTIPMRIRAMLGVGLALAVSPVVAILSGCAASPRSSAAPALVEPPSGTGERGEMSAPSGVFRS